MRSARAERPRAAAVERRAARDTPPERAAERPSRGTAFPRAAARRPATARPATPERRAALALAARAVERGIRERPLLAVERRPPAGERRPVNRPHAPRLAPRERPPERRRDRSRWCSHNAPPLAAAVPTAAVARPTVPHAA
ncbi:hypothetical protein [Streptomonospora litoralis]|uniref:hypothetical protein n=1 Tax=Streptomonospora litoralis TaxID=2498135 RepID=UPI0010359FEB|nr:hypothetical protein [Streptomonospora litoralis]